MTDLARTDARSLDQIVADPRFNLLRLCMLGDLGLSKPEPLLYGLHPSPMNDQAEADHNAELGWVTRRS